MLAGGGPTPLLPLAVGTLVVVFDIGYGAEDVDAVGTPLLTPVD